MNLTNGKADILSSGLSVKFALPMHKNQFIATLQETSIVGSLAIQDLTRASDIISSRTLDPFATLIVISIVYIVVGWAVSSLMSLLVREKHIEGTI